MRIVLIISICLFTLFVNVDTPSARRHHKARTYIRHKHHVHRNGKKHRRHVRRVLPAVPSIMDGIDISRHQKEIQWGEMLCGKKKPQFVYARCMGLGLRKDYRYDSYIDSAQYHGVPIGSYLFYTNFNKRFLQLEDDTLKTDSMHQYVRAVSGSALIHFLEFKNRVDRKKQNLLPVIDVEEQSIFDFSVDRKMERPHNEYLKLNVFILACMLRAEYGERPIIYSNQNFYSKFLAPTFDDYPLWIARYRTHREPHIKSDLPFPYRVKPILWQFTDRGIIKGIPHYVDMDHFINDATIETIKIKKKYDDTQSLFNDSTLLLCFGGRGR